MKVIFYFEIDLMKMNIEDNPIFFRAKTVTTIGKYHLDRYCISMPTKFNQKDQI
jgi:hypothetical protein